MKLKTALFALTLALGSLSANAETPSSGSTFHFSTQVSRTVEKDVMEATVFSRKAGKDLKALKKAVSADLNSVLDAAKKERDIHVEANGISNYADYDNKGKVRGWVAEGRIYLRSKNFDAIAAILDNLGNNLAIEQVYFSVSPEKQTALEDEMTLEIIKQFQHKAELIQKSLNASKYRLSDVQLNTPNGEQHYAPRMYMAEMSMKASETSLPLEAGKQTISATASGKVVFE